MRIYLAGPMSGLPKSNFPAFDEAAAKLRELGFDVVSPAELDDSTDREIALTDAPPVKTWGDFLARDVKVIADGGVRGIVFLPKWEDSRGAQLEATVGLLQKPFFFFEYKDGNVISLVREQVAAIVFTRI